MKGEFGITKSWVSAEGEFITTLVRTGSAVREPLHPSKRLRCTGKHCGLSLKGKNVTERLRIWEGFFCFWREGEEHPGAAFRTLCGSVSHTSRSGLRSFYCRGRALSPCAQQHALFGSGSRGVSEQTERTVPCSALGSARMTALLVCVQPPQPVTRPVSERRRWQAGLACGRCWGVCRPRASGASRA